MEILGLIPARGNSKGVPQKNKRLLGKQPLIGYSIASALGSRQFSRLVVSTDDPEIAEISKKLGAEVPFLRPAALASDSAPTIDTVVHALEYFQEQGQYFDAVCLLQPTVPFRAISDISGAVKKFTNTRADALISVRKIPHTYNPHWAFEQQADSAFLALATGESQIIPRRQELPEAYHRDGAIYITKSDVVLKEKSLYGQQICAYECVNTPTINIDTEEDWQQAVEYLKTHEG